MHADMSQGSVGGPLPPLPPIPPSLCNRLRDVSCSVVRSETVDWTNLVPNMSENARSTSDLPFLRASLSVNDTLLPTTEGVADRGFLAFMILVMLREMMCAKLIVTGSRLHSCVQSQRDANTDAALC